MTQLTSFPGRSATASPGVVVLVRTSGSIKKNTGWGDPKVETEKKTKKDGRRAVRVERRVLEPSVGLSAVVRAAHDKLNYPVHPTPEDKQHYAAFMRSLAHVLPCRVCRENYTATLHKFPVEEHLNSRHDFARFMYRIHNSVPNRPPLPVSFEDMRHTYETFRSKCGPQGCVVPNRFVRSRTLLTVIPESHLRDEPSFYLSKLCLHEKDDQT